MIKIHLKSSFIPIMVAVFAYASWPAGAAGDPKRLSASEVYRQSPLYFIENHGQLDKRVRFYNSTRGQTTFFTSEGIVFRLNGSDTSFHHGVPLTVRLTPLNMTNDTDIVAEKLQPTKVNHFKGKDPKKWRTFLPAYGSVVYREVFPGIDMRFYGTGRQLEYDVVVKPGSVPSRVRLSYRGIEGLEITQQGDLSLRLKQGAKFIQKKPVVYQEIAGKRVPREGRYRLLPSDPGCEGHVFGFEVGSYDRQYALVIDPVLVSTTYLGGTANDHSYAIAADASGNCYVTGITLSNDFPLDDSAPYDLGETLDAFVIKLNPTDGKIIYATYIGGTGDDTALDIAVDDSGSCYVTGYTDSSDFPVKNPFQGMVNGEWDGFVVKINPSGDSLVYATYLGGSGDDEVSGIAVDDSGNCYVTGYTDSADFPLKNPFQVAFGGNRDAFVTQLNKNGDGLVYSTYLGGSSSDEGTAVAVDGSKSATITGCTASIDFPTQNPFQGAIGGDGDAFVVRVTPSGDALEFATYLGGSKDDKAMALTLDGLGNCCVTGYTESDNFPTKTPFQGAIAGEYDAFVTQLNKNGNALAYSTYLGGSEDDMGSGIAVNVLGDLFVTGYTQSDNFPIKDPFQGALGGEWDAFVTQLKAGGNALVYSTYLGNGELDFGNDIALYLSIDCCVTGTIQKNGYYDGFVRRMAWRPPHR